MPSRAVGQPKELTPARRANNARSEASFLESALHVQLFAHLTTPQRISEMALRGVFTDWILRLQARHHVTLGWVRAIERRPSPHIHAAVLAATPLDCAQAADLWQGIVAPRYSGAAKVELYQAGLCGMEYILKTLDTVADEIHFSDNAAAFAVTARKSIFQASPSQRRQERRIHEQLRCAEETGDCTSRTARSQAAK